MRTTIALSWASALAVCVAIVKLTSIGPVIFVISQERGMGVHTGDALCLIPLAMAAGITALAITSAKKA